MAKKKAKKKTEQLTILQESFVRILFKNPDLTQQKAYIQAGYKARGSTADSNASTLVKIPKIQARLKVLRDNAAKRAEISIAKTVKEMSIIAFSDIADFVNIDEEGTITIKSIDSMDEVKRRAIESVKVRVTTSGKGDDKYSTCQTELKLCSKLGALDDIMKHLGGYEKDNKQKAQSIFDMLAIVGINVSDKGTKAVSSKVG